MKEEFKVATMREQAETAMACGGMFAISGQQAKRMLDRIVELESQIERITAQRLQENSMNLKVKLHLNERATNAEAELAALKGDRVPYAYSYNYAGCETCEGFQDWRKELSRERPPEWMVETGKVTDLVELFTDPQKPIVLPKSFSQSDYLSHGLEPSDAYGLSYGSSEMRALCKKAIEAACGKVEELKTKIRL
jgi:hypothetical protein